jgi:hypothetical protein
VNEAGCVEKERRLDCNPGDRPGLLQFKCVANEKLQTRCYASFSTCVLERVLVLKDPVCEQHRWYIETTGGVSSGGTLVRSRRFVARALAERVGVCACVE